MNTVNHRMQPFIVSAMRKIIQSLQETAADLEIPEAPSHVGSESAQPYPNAFRLDCSSAEVVSGETLIFPGTGSAAEEDWCVLHISDAHRGQDVRAFNYRGRMRATLNSEEFVRRAYELIFMRSVDDSGLRIYPPIIESHQLTRREVLKILADSDEAKALKLLMIIIPHPSSWLSPLNIDPDDDTSFPTVFVDICYR